MVTTTVERVRKHTPIKAESALLKPFVGLPLSAISVPSTRKQYETAIKELKRCKAIGFDTESKPTFEAGETSDGPHVVQFATPNRAYIFQLHRQESHRFVTQILESEDIVKVGFGLKSDRGLIHRKLGIKIRAVLDLNKVFRSEGYRAATGVRAAVAIVFNQKFHKSKQITTSNWALQRLSERQLLYAANDAYAAIQVLTALGKPLDSLPIAGLSLTQHGTLQVLPEST